MSCCPAAPPIQTSSGVGYINAGQESEIQKGESVECYMNRAGNTTGRLDDATGNIPGKIENTSIPVNVSNASVNVTFRLTTSIPQAVPVSWTMTTGGVAWSHVTVNFTSGGATATFVGTFSDPTDRKKPYEVLVAALDGASAIIDSRTFKFSPVIADGKDSIRLTSPLPGSIVNSKFGPRIHPITGDTKPHTGIDMKMPDRSVIDVVAAGDGEVTFAGVNGSLTSGYGNCVRIKHLSGSGSLLCTTLYGHMEKIYVAVGQKVAAGQKIGKEGTTGSSTGNHLHFEVRLPNNTPVDPVPYLGGVSVADVTSPSGEGSSITPSPVSGAALTQAQVDAQSTSCPAAGMTPGHPEIPVVADPSPLPPAIPGDAWEHAWYFTMTFEVGPHWMTTPAYSPGDPAVDAGSIDTDLNRKKVGYKGSPTFPGGETKFGVAQNPNKSTVVVRTLGYEEAKSFGKSHYWSISGSTGCPSHAPLVGIMLFDMNYLHGPGNARKILSNSGVTANPGASHDQQLADCSTITTAALAFIGTLNPTYIRGWTNRANARLSFVKSLPYPLS